MSVSVSASLLPFPPVFQSSTPPPSDFQCRGRFATNDILSFECSVHNLASLTGRDFTAILERKSANNGSVRVSLFPFSPSTSTANYYRGSGRVCTSANTEAFPDTGDRTPLMSGVMVGDTRGSRTRSTIGTPRTTAMAGQLGEHPLKLPLGRAHVPVQGEVAITTMAVSPASRLDVASKWCERKTLTVAIQQRVTSRCRPSRKNQLGSTGQIPTPF
jgi:hypothetical protein